MENLVYVLSTFIIVYLIYYIVIISKPKRLEKFILKGRETNIIKSRYNINFDKVNKKTVANYFAIANSFMISLLTFIVLFIENYLLKLLVAFLIFTLLIIVIYLFIGKLIKNKEEEN